jgi:beta-aspartyl-peptidase (threonine type)
MTIHLAACGSSVGACVLALGLAVPACAQPRSPIAIAIHGGAGTITRESLTPEKERAYREKLEEALRAGHSILQRGGSSMDACVAAVRVMEDSPLFNAGKGSVYTADQTHEMDACVMDGATRKAGAVAAVSHVKNPIELARLVMERSEHVMLVGEGAEKFAQQNGVGLVDASYFDTPQRLEQLRKAKAKEAAPATAPAMSEQDKHGTVGAVAVDQQGNLAAATSTGGMTNKRFGRVGDSPIVGAGTYADNDTCAVSATGHGEFLMRLVIGHEVASLMRYGKLSVTDAADRAVNDELTKLGGTGGVIAIDRQGNIAMPFNTEGMYRGSIDTAGKLRVEIYR